MRAMAGGCGERAVVGPLIDECGELFVLYLGKSTRSSTCNVGGVLEDEEGANEEAGNNYMYEALLIGD